MPFVVARVNMPISSEQELALKSRLGQAIGLVPGKSEECLLVDVEDGCRLYLAGDGAEPLAYLEVSVFGNEGHAGYAPFAQAATRAFPCVNTPMCQHPRPLDTLRECVNTPVPLTHVRHV